MENIGSTAYLIPLNLKLTPLTAKQINNYFNNPKPSKQQLPQESIEQLKKLIAKNYIGLYSGIKSDPQLAKEFRFLNELFAVALRQEDFVNNKQLFKSCIQHFIEQFEQSIDTNQSYSFDKRNLLTNMVLINTNIAELKQVQTISDKLKQILVSCFVTEQDEAIACLTPEYKDFVTYLSAQDETYSSIRNIYTLFSYHHPEATISQIVELYLEYAFKPEYNLDTAISKVGLNLAKIIDYFADNLNAINEHHLYLILNILNTCTAEDLNQRKADSNYKYSIYKQRKVILINLRSLFERTEILKHNDILLDHYINALLRFNSCYSRPSLILNIYGLLKKDKLPTNEELQIKLIKLLCSNPKFYTFVEEGKSFLCNESQELQFLIEAVGSVIKEFRVLQKLSQFLNDLPEGKAPDIKEDYIKLYEKNLLVLLLQQLEQGSFSLINQFTIEELPVILKDNLYKLYTKENLLDLITHTKFSLDILIKFANEYFITSEEKIIFQILNDIEALRSMSASLDLDKQKLTQLLTTIKYTYYFYCNGAYNYVYPNYWHQDVLPRLLELKVTNKQAINYINTGTIISKNLLVEDKAHLAYLFEMYSKFPLLLELNSPFIYDGKNRFLVISTNEQLKESRLRFYPANTNLRFQGLTIVELDGSKYREIDISQQSLATFPKWVQDMYANLAKLNREVVAKFIVEQIIPTIIGFSAQYIMAKLDKISSKPLSNNLIKIQNKLLKDQELKDELINGFKSSAIAIERYSFSNSLSKAITTLNDTIYELIAQTASSKNIDNELSQYHGKLTQYILAKHFNEGNNLTDEQKEQLYLISIILGYTAGEGWLGNDSYSITTFRFIAANMLAYLKDFLADKITDLDINFDINNKHSIPYQLTKPDPDNASGKQKVYFCSRSIMSKLVIENYTKKIADKELQLTKIV
jgi:hypothetical protein